MKRSTWIVLLGLHVVALADNGSDRASRDLEEIAGIEIIPSACPAPAGPELAELFSIARVFETTGEYSKTLHILENAAILKGGDRFEIWHEMARCALLLGDTPRARTCAERAILCAPLAVTGHYLLGQIDARTGRIDAAIARWRTCTLLGESKPHDPWVTAAWYHLASTLESAGYLRAAAQAFARFDDAIWRTHPEHRFSQAVEEATRGIPAEQTIERQLALWSTLDAKSEAVEAAAAAVSRQPTNDAIAALYVDRLLAAGMADRAFEFAAQRLRKALRASDGKVPSLLPALRAAQSRGALEAFSRDIADLAEKAGRPEVLQDLAEKLTAAGESAAAGALWARLQSATPEDARVAWQHAWSQLRAGRIQDAVQILGRYLKASPFDGEVVTLALAKRLDSPPPGLDVVTAAAAPDDVVDQVAYQLLALASGVAQPPGEAPTPSSQPASAPSDFAATQLLTEAARHVERFEWPEALRKADEALRLAPRSAAGFFLRGRALDGLGQFDQAEDALREAARAADRNPLYAFELARFYRRRGDENLVSAQRYFQEALEADPHMARAAEALVDCYLIDSPPKTELAQIALEKAEQAELSSDSLRRMHTELKFGAARWSDPHLAELEQQLAAHPDDLTTGRKLVEGKLERGRAVEAISIVARLRQLAPGDEEVLRLYAVTQAAALDFAAALEAYRSLQDRYPARFDESISVAVLLLNDFRVEEGRQQLQSMLKTSFNDADKSERVKNLLFLAHAKFRDLDGGLRLIEDWDPRGEDEEWRVRRLMALLEADRGREALALAERDLRGVEIGEARERYCVIAEATRAYKELDAKLQQWIAHSDGLEQLDLMMRRVTVLREAGQAQEALNLLDSIDKRVQDITANEGGMRELQAARVECLIAAGKMQEGLDLADRLLESEHVRAVPEARVPIRSALLDGLRGQREYDRALAYLERWHAAGDPPPFDQLIALWRQEFAQLAGKDELYFALAQKQLERNPRDIGINNDLGYTWADHGIHLDRAEQMIRYAVATEPLNAAYLDSLGWLYYKLGNMAQARHWLSRSVQLVDGQDATLYDHLGDACWRDGARAEAKEAWQHARKLAQNAKPNSTAATNSEFLPRLRAKLTALEGGAEPEIAKLAVK